MIERLTANGSWAADTFAPPTLIDFYKGARVERTCLSVLTVWKSDGTAVIYIVPQPKEEIHA